MDGEVCRQFFNIDHCINDSYNKYSKTKKSFKIYESETKCNPYKLQFEHLEDNIIIFGVPYSFHHLNNMEVSTPPKKNSDEKNCKDVMFINGTKYFDNYNYETKNRVVIKAHNIIKI